MSTPNGQDRDSVAYRLCADPRAYFRPLRAKSAIDTTEGLGGSVQVLTLDEGQKILRDHSTFSSALAGAQPGRPPQIPLQLDPPEHARYRRLLDPAFSPRTIAGLERDVADLTNELIDSFIAAGRCDFSQEISVPLPSAIFLKLFGLPTERLDEFLAIKNGLMRAEGETDEERQAVRAQAAGDAAELFRAVIAERTAQPHADVISRLVHAEVDGQKLSADEAVNVCNLLLLAGLDTVSISLQCMLFHLATHPEDRDLLVSDPTKVNAVVEELLRWETPVQGVTRVATRDVEVAGCPFPKGTPFRVMIASIDVDPASAGGWDAIDFDRENNRHLAFGGGVHRCLGSHLARLELRTVLTEWHRRIPNYEVDPGIDIEWNGAPLRGIEHLPLVWPVEA